MAEEASPKTGIFTITTGAAGAPVLKVCLSVAADGKCMGTADYFHVVSPPVHEQNVLTGWTHTTGLGKAKQFFALQDAHPKGMVGGRYITSVLIAMDGIWATEGTASYVYFTDNPQTKHYSDIPVKCVWQELA